MEETSKESLSLVLGEGVVVVVRISYVDVCAFAFIHRPARVQNRRRNLTAPTTSSRPCALLLPQVVDERLANKVVFVCSVFIGQIQIVVVLVTNTNTTSHIAFILVIIDRDAGFITIFPVTYSPERAKPCAPASSCASRFHYSVSSRLSRCGSLSTPTAMNGFSFFHAHSFFICCFFL